MPDPYAPVQNALRNLGQVPIDIYNVRRQQRQDNALSQKRQWDMRQQGFENAMAQEKMGMAQQKQSQAMSKERMNESVMFAHRIMSLSPELQPAAYMEASRYMQSKYGGEPAPPWEQGGRDHVTALAGLAQPKEKAGLKGFDPGDVVLREDTGEVVREATPKAEKTKWTLKTGADGELYYVSETPGKDPIKAGVQMELSDALDAASEEGLKGKDKINAARLLYNTMFPILRDPLGVETGERRDVEGGTAPDFSDWYKNDFPRIIQGKLTEKKQAQEDQKILEAELLASVGYTEKDVENAMEENPDLTRKDVLNMVREIEKARNQ